MRRPVGGDGQNCKPNRIPGAFRIAPARGLAAILPSQYSSDRAARCGGAPCDARPTPPDFLTERTAAFLMVAALDPLPSPPQKVRCPRCPDLPILGRIEDGKVVIRKKGYPVAFPWRLFCVCGWEYTGPGLGR